MSDFYYFIVIMLAIVAGQMLFGIGQLILRIYRSHKERGANDNPKADDRTAGRESARKAPPSPTVNAIKFFVVLFLSLILTIHMLLEAARYRYWVDWLILPCLGIFLIMQYLSWRRPDLCNIIIITDPLDCLRKYCTTDYYRCGCCGYNLMGHMDSLRDEKQTVICPECGKNIDEVGVTLPGYADRRYVERLKAKVYLLLSVAAALYLCLIIVFRFWLMSSPFAALALLLFIIKCGQCYNASRDLKSR